MSAAERQAALDTALAAHAEAVRRYAAAREAEMRCEDDGPRVRHQAIQRLLERGVAASATGAEKLLWQDDEYAAWQQMRRTYVVATIYARGGMFAAEMRARAAAPGDEVRS